MTLEEAIKHAQGCVRNDVTSTSGKALIALLEAYNAKQDAQPVAIPDGFALVPIDPTPQMLARAIAPRGSYSTDQTFEAAVIYRLMLAASPPPPDSSADAAVTVWYIPDDNGLPLQTTGFDIEAAQWRQAGKRVLSITQPAAIRSAGLSDADMAAIRDLLGTLDKHEGTIERCARHAKAIRALLSTAADAEQARMDAYTNGVRDERMSRQNDAAAEPVSSAGLWEVESLKKEIDALKESEKQWKASAEMYANAWERELAAFDGTIRRKRHHIDAMVLTTQDLVALAKKNTAAEVRREALEEIPYHSERRSMTNIEELAKKIAEAVAKNSGVAPQLCYAPALFVLQDVLAELEQAKAVVKESLIAATSAGEMPEFVGTLLDKNKPLEPEIAKILADNAWSLYARSSDGEMPEVDDAKLIAMFEAKLAEKPTAYLNGGCVYQVTQSELLEFVRQYAAQQAKGDAEDAARYRWMRVTFVDDDLEWPADVAEATSGEQLDAAIDAARALSQTAKKGEAL